MSKLISEEEQDHMTRENDAYIVMLNSKEYQRWCAGLHPIKGCTYDDEGNTVYSEDDS